MSLLTFWFLFLGECSMGLLYRLGIYSWQLCPYPDAMVSIVIFLPGTICRFTGKCTSQQKVDTFFIFYTLKTEHSTPYIVLVSNSLMSMQVFLH